MHIISGGDDADQARDGDFADKAARYRRSDEFLDIVKREWSSATPFDYDGEFYQVEGALSQVRPDAGKLPVYFAGASADAVRVGGRQADVYAFWGEPLAAIKERIAAVRASAEHAGRTINRFSVSTRPIAAATEEAAWARAHRILAVTTPRRTRPTTPRSSSWSASRTRPSPPSAAEEPKPNPSRPRSRPTPTKGTDP